MAKLKKMELDYFQNKDFVTGYLQLLNTRLVYSNNLIESDNGPISKLYDNNNILVLNDNFKAFAILVKNLEFSKKELTVELIKQIANTINKHSQYIKDGYRTLDNNVKFENQFSIEKVENIENAMNDLLNKYYNEWDKLDLFEREARFNIEFLRIHPFEDGNGRTSRLILNYNMLRQGHAPILMPESIREDYFKARNREDINWIKNLFEKESEKELFVIDELIKAFEDDIKNDLSLK